MGPIGCSETSVNNYQYALRDFPEELRSIFLFRSVASVKETLCLDSDYRIINDNQLIGRFCIFDHAFS
jgi:hypothetical protein